MVIAAAHGAAERDLPMNVRTLCLAILNSGESTGYEIRKHSTEGHFSHFVDASYGSIYPALTKMEQDGLVTSREERQAGKPSRKVYSITDAGRLEFLSALSKPAQRDVFKSEFLLLALSAEIMQPHILSQAIDTQQEWLDSELAKINAAQDDIDLAGAEWVAEYARHCVNASRSYIKKNRHKLETIAGQRLPPHVIAAE